MEPQTRKLSHPSLPQAQPETTASLAMQADPQYAQKTSEDIPPSAISPFLGQPDPSADYDPALLLASTGSVSSLTKLRTVNYGPVTTAASAAPSVATVTTHVKRLRVFKIIVIGDSGVGKTCLTFRFCGGEFRPDAEVTIGVDFRERVLDVEGEKIKIQLWDTAGQERFRRSMVQHYYRNTHAVVFVYDVTKASSFESLSEWIAECNRFSLGSEVPRILVGNKCDCKNQQVVPTHSAQRFADMHNMLLFETSAKDDSEANHVEAIFMTLALKLKRERPFLPPFLSPNDGPDMRVISLNVDANAKSSGDQGGCGC